MQKRKYLIFADEVREKSLMKKFSIGIVVKETKMAAATATTAKVVCQICKLSAADELNYGPWKTSDGYTVHYFCAVSVWIFPSLSIHWTIFLWVCSFHFISAVVIGFGYERRMPWRHRWLSGAWNPCDAKSIHENKVPLLSEKTGHCEMLCTRLPTKVPCGVWCCKKMPKHFHKPVPFVLPWPCSNRSERRHTCSRWALRDLPWSDGRVSCTDEHSSMLHERLLSQIVHAEKSHQTWLATQMPFLRRSWNRWRLQRISVGTWNLLSRDRCR